MFNKIILLSIVFITFIFSTNNSIWNTKEKLVYSENELIIMLNENIAPKLGIDPPLDINSLTILNSRLSSLGKLIDFKPVFIMHENFTEKERLNNLHQFYIATYENKIDIQNAINILINSTEIITVDPNYRHQAYLVPNDQYYNLQWGHDNTGQAISYGGGNVGTIDCDTDTDLAWDISQGGEDIIISIIDTGVNGNHEEFSGKMVEGYDFINNDSDASDDHMHGTACAGIAAAQGNNSVGISGVAWNSKIMPVKVLSGDGFGDDVSISNGIQFSAQEGAHVISMSLGGGGFNSATNYAIEYANDVNTVVLSASGNDNSSNISYPSAYEGSISVGSLSPCNERKNMSSCDGENFWGSNYGTGLDFLSPGVRIHTTALNGGYMSDFNGTSSATPHAAGIAALIYSVNPDLTADNVREIMQVSCDDLGSPGWDEQTGYGRLNAYMSLVYLTGGPEIGLESQELYLNVETGEQSIIELPVINGGEIDLNISIDPFGYSHSTSDEGAEYNWINILDEGTLYNFASNDVSGSILDIGFIFPFYNENYDSIIINANGWVGFGEDNAEWDNATIPSNAAPSPAIFPFWDDLNPVNDSCNDYCSGNVYYHGNEERFVITFNEVAHWWTNYENSYYTFQVVLYPNGDIDLNYQNITGSYSPTIGMQDYNGNNGLLLAYASNPSTDLFVHNEFSVPINLRAYWLNINPLNLTISPGNVSNLNVIVNAENLTAGTYSDMFYINSNDFNNPSVPVSVTAEVGGNSCMGWELGDINNDLALDVLDVVLLVNIVLDDSNASECELWSADVNQDAEINVQDIVITINNILDS